MKNIFGKESRLDHALKEVKTNPKEFEKYAKLLASKRWRNSSTGKLLEPEENMNLVEGLTEAMAVGSKLGGIKYFIVGAGAMFFVMNGTTKLINLLEEKRFYDSINDELDKLDAEFKELKEE